MMWDIRTYMLFNLCHVTPSFLDLMFSLIHAEGIVPHNARSRRG